MSNLESVLYYLSKFYFTKHKLTVARPPRTSPDTTNDGEMRRQAMAEASRSFHAHNQPISDVDGKMPRNWQHYAFKKRVPLLPIREKLGIVGVRWAPGSELAHANNLNGVCFAPQVLIPPPMVSNKEEVRPLRYTTERSGLYYSDGSGTTPKIKKSQANVLI